MLFASATTLLPIILIAVDISCCENTSAVPVNCRVVSAVSVNINTSWRVINPVTMPDPCLTRKNPAELVISGFHSSGLGPTSALTLAHRIRFQSYAPLL